MKKLSDTILNKLKNELSPLLVYHNFEHTALVLKSTKVISNAQKLTKDSKKILLAAALLHDTGFLTSTESLDHEKRSVEIANKILPDFGFEKKEIIEINKLIMSTLLPQNPDGQLSEILCDADLFYLGTHDYFTISERFYLELNNFNKINSEKDWLIMQIDFLDRHQYFTKFAKQNLEPIKQNNLKLLKKRYENQKFES